MCSAGMKTGSVFSGASPRAPRCPISCSASAGAATSRTAASVDAMRSLADRHRGLIALAGREIERVTKLWTQTVVAPVLSSALFILVFGLSIGGRIKQVEGFDYK